MNMTYAIIFASSLVLAISSCARKRSVERQVDTEGNRWAKAEFENGKRWLGKVTIVNNGSNSAFGFYGLKSDVQIGYFRFTKDYLQFLAAEDVFEGKNSGERVLNAWSIQHTDVHQKVSGGRVSNVETENDQISWEQKRFFRVDWESAIVSEAASFPFDIDENCWSKKSSRLVDKSQEISASYVGFTIAVDYQVNPTCITEPQYFRADYTHTIHYKYSYRVDETSDYKPYVYTGETDPLFKKFGFFSSVVPRINEQGRLENVFLMNRWHPKKTHTIYFSETFPEKYKWIYNDAEKGIIARTNKLFEQNKLPIRFEIKDNDGSKKFGDIRYSFVHFVEDPDYQAPFGYGPSDVHPRTGEIIGSQTIIWVADLKLYLQRIKEGEERAPNKALSSSVLREMSRIMGVEPSRWSERATFLTDQGFSNDFRFLLPEYTYGQPGSTFANRGKPEFKFTMDERLERLKTPRSQSFNQLEMELKKQQTVIDKHLHTLSERSFGPKAQAYSTVWRLDESMFTKLGSSLKLVDIEKATQDILYRVAIHEFGHNLNLRHNFYGSVDAGLDRATEKEPTKLVTSSVMDYLNLNDEIGATHDWEEYDRAALLFAYSEGRIDLVKRNQQPFLYCTDEHVAINPMCNQFDRGSSPSEVLVSMIENYEEAYWIRNFRYGRAFWNTGAHSSSIFGTMASIKRFVAFHQQAFETNDVIARLSQKQDFNIFAAQAVANSIRLDMDRAVHLSAAFYAAIIKQADIDRSYRDSYDNFSGSLTRLGIMSDKVFAARFFMGDEGYPLNPNTPSPLSFVPLRNDPLIGPILENILFDVYLNAGQMYPGYDSLIRSYFALNAASYFDFSGSRGAIELVRVSCFKKASFEAAFNVDADAYGTPPRPIDLASITPTYNGNVDPYFRDEPQIVVVRYNSDYYVAGLNKNPYAAALIANGDLNGALNNYLNISILTEGRIPECR
jgi:hypothetical protein